MVESEQGKNFGRLDAEGRIVLSVSGSRDIVEAVKGNKPISEFCRLTTDDGLNIEYNGMGNFTLVSASPEVIQTFLRDKRYNVGTRIFKKGSEIPLVQKSSTI